MFCGFVTIRRRQEGQVEPIGKNKMSNLKIKLLPIETKSFVDALKKDSTQENIQEVRRVKYSEASADLFDQKILQPIIFTHIPVKKDAIKNLASRMADMKLNVRVGDYIDPQKYAFSRIFEQENLHSFIKRIPETTDYVGNAATDQELIDLLEIKHPKFYDSTKFVQPSMWLGGNGCITPLHKDGADNFALQVEGQKRWTIFRVQDIPKLEMKRAIEASDFSISMIDLRHPDTNKFPSYASTSPISFTLNPGEMLFLPAHWGHFVESLSPSLMINFWRPEVQPKHELKPWNYYKKKTEE